MSALYGVNRAFQDEATKLLRDYLAVIALVLQESQAAGEIQPGNIEAAALLVLSLTETYVHSARVLGWSQQQISRQASLIARQYSRGNEDRAVLTLSLFFLYYWMGIHSFNHRICLQGVHR